ncbi:hypothetical protein GP486_007160 [Trichoglossum hirsutum]|uniref:Aminoglycoside phosphotransferase domain-containing protein n=1 Tax=Trichoglossum hirsutum TaxID=265104 RepID=A0A9P8L312_9PEZI|nr:hypothetical protein GP486_007160 [Trichoglossum hirsutum]
MADFQVGCDAWKCYSDISYKVEKDVRAFQESIQWDNIISFCRESRGVLCNMGPKFVVGSKNLVKVVEFADGIKWVAKLPLPRPGVYRINGNVKSQSTALRSEVATFRFLKTHTAIPVPKIHAFDDGASGLIGAPCVLMEYIHGTPADVLLEEGEDTFGDLQQDGHILEQLAKIHVQLTRVKFDGIGSIYQDEHDGRFFVGPDIETGIGPYSTPNEYYEVLCKHRQALYGSGTSTVGALDTTLPELFLEYMPIFCKMQHEGPFSLANRNLGAHSILIDSNLNIISMIDCSSIIAGPFHMAAQYPRISPIDDPIPGERPPVDHRSNIAAMRFRAYLDLLWREGEGGGPFRRAAAVGLAQAMSSDAAQFVRALNEFKMRSWDRNRRWLHSFEFMYERGCEERRLMEEADQAEDDDEDEVPHTDGPVSQEEDPGFVEGSLTPPTMPPTTTSTTASTSTASTSTASTSTASTATTVTPTASAATISLPVRAKTAEQGQEKTGESSSQSPKSGSSDEAIADRGLCGGS